MPAPHEDFAAMRLQDAADLQGDLLGACNDLDRLQALLTSACGELSQGFHGAIALLQPHAGGGLPGSELLAQVQRLLSGSVTALQFEDLATQLIAHARQCLRRRADRLALDALGADDDDGDIVVDGAELRPNPVTQDEMDAGSVELF